MFFRSTTRFYDLQVGLVDESNLLSLRHHNFDVIYLTEHSSFYGKASAKQGDPLKASDLNLTDDLVEEIHERNRRKLNEIGSAYVGCQRGHCRKLRSRCRSCERYSANWPVCPASTYFRTRVTSA
jgi:hypothetical protein